MRKVIFIILAIFCYQHIFRDYLQSRGVKDWYTTEGHAWMKFIPDTPRNNYIGMVVLFVLGTLFVYLAFKK